ncbi:MAG: cobalamin-independent methionine synthase II family protein [Trebonia sp.]
MNVESAETREQARPGGSRRAFPRAETVGSLLRGDAVVRAARRSSPADNALLGDAVRDAIRLQEEVGLDVITDGEVRRVSWAQTPRFVDAFAVGGGQSALNWRGGTEGRFGATPTGATPTGTGTGTGSSSGGYPSVIRRVATAPRTGDMAAEYAFLARYAHGRTKFTMPAPSYHRRYWSPAASPAAGYASPEEFLVEIRDYLRSVAHTLIDLGCDYIQLDAPNYGSLCDPDTTAAMRAAGRDPDVELEFDAALDSSLFDGLSVTSALHVCRGNGPAGAWHSAGGYGAISARLFPRLAVDRLLLEYDSDRAGGFEPLADTRQGTAVVLGLLTTKAPQLEHDGDVLARIDEAARFKPLAELALSTQCGFASVPIANPVTPKDQRAKLKLVVRLARQAWPQ